MAAAVSISHKLHSWLVAKAKTASSSYSWPAPWRGTQVHSRVCSSAESSQPAPIPIPTHAHALPMTSDSSWSFFNRTIEQEWLQQLADEEPDKVWVFCGPTGSGKTSVFKTFVKGREAAIVLDCNLLTPTAFTKAVAQTVLVLLAPSDIKEELQQLLRGSKGLVAALRVAGVISTLLGKPAVKRSGVEESVDMSAAIKAAMDAVEAGKQEAVEPMDVIAQVISAQEAAHARNTKGKGQAAQKVPVIVLDEIHQLYGWLSKPEYAVVLRQLGAYMSTAVSRQKACHIWLVTSDYPMTVNLASVSQLKSFHVRVISNFNKEEAKRFLEHELQRLVGPTVKLADAEWQTLYKALGGHAHDLSTVVKFYELNGQNWGSALQELQTQRLHSVDIGLDGGAGYTGADYADAALLLLNKNGIVPRRDMAAHLGRQAGGSPAQQKAAGVAVLNSLIQANLLQACPCSPWMLDLDSSVCRAGDTIVMTPTPLDLHCLCMSREMLEAQASTS